MTDTSREFSPAEIVRIHEANCELDYVSAEEQNFRIAVMKHIARRMNLPELKGATITGQGTGVPRPKGGSGGDR